MYFVCTPEQPFFFLGTTYCSEACSTEEISWGVKWVLETFFKISPHPSRRRKIWDTLIQVHFILDMHLCTLISRFDVLNFKHVFNTIFNFYRWTMKLKTSLYILMKNIFGHYKNNVLLNKLNLFGSSSTLKYANEDYFYH